MDATVQAVANNLDLSQNKPLKDALFDALRKTIILGDISAGTHINEKKLSEELNVSRTPIRHALRRLASENLVESIPGVSMVVRGITIKDAYEIFDIRKELDSLATRKAMLRMTAADFTTLRELLEQTERELDEVPDIMMISYFTDFNQFIYQHCDMPHLVTIVFKLQAYLVYFRDISIVSRERRGLALQEHWRIYQAMVNQDEVQINLIIREHLGQSLQFIIKEMRAHNLD
ncbi:GntR family transcriptional regulator [Lactobacillus sp. CBA3605]|uniref:GntR family transcriptional regulator n=1 Tax=Lactobacillus sp. CBA3605 TaxID=2099788 RepID=UPI000CFCA3D2|nr:GntR family transcriptional regulator [Lactobacillus sp. CBA3605]AVK61798.1 GntR family transcriptional regulator [Lactobacillus sp. CBA3605]